LHNINADILYCYHVNYMYTANHVIQRCGSLIYVQNKCTGILLSC